MDAFKTAFLASLGKCAPLILILAALYALFELRVMPRLEPSNPAAGVDAGKLARAFAPEVLDTLGDAWVAAAAKVEAPGSKVADVQKCLHDTWDSLRVAAYSRTVAPALAATLPEGTEPTDVQRPMLGKLYRDFGTALKKASGK